MFGIEIFSDKSIRDDERAMIIKAAQQTAVLTRKVIRISRTPAANSCQKYPVTIREERT